ncbi:MAG: (2Fe-2S)-binding protein [Rhodospirillales bacterium]|nr:(2Fe-2S)-binding protein [Rhodospirillales bacterium]
MVTIRFVDERERNTQSIVLPAGTSRTVLAIAKDHGVPILFNCEAGACGACIVRVEPLTRSPVSLSRIDADERAVLDAIGRTTGRRAADGPRRADRADCDRLACRCVVGDEDILVTYPAGLGDG